MKTVWKLSYPDSEIVLFESRQAAYASCILTYGDITIKEKDKVFYIETTYYEDPLELYEENVCDVHLIEMVGRKNGTKTR